MDMFVLGLQVEPGGLSGGDGLAKHLLKSSGPFDSGGLEEPK